MFKIYKIKNTETNEHLAYFHKGEEGFNANGTIFDNIGTTKRTVKKFVKKYPEYEKKLKIIEFHCFQRRIKKEK